MTKILCDVFKTRKKDEMYLYVAKKDGMSRVPEELLAMFGQPELAMTLILTAEKKLGRADTGKVIAELDERGFYLQMPPAKEPYMLDLFTKRDPE
ncbi:MAG: YcgL domain-containing protein [Thalassolituus sp.]